jgi:acetyl-CoA synthetase
MLNNELSIKHHESKVVTVKEEIKNRAWIDKATYISMYKESIDNPEKFWAEQAKIIDWIKPFTKVKNTNFEGQPSIKWFEDGQLNISANCIDRL